MRINILAASKGKIVRHYPATCIHAFPVAVKNR